MAESTEVVVRRFTQVLTWRDRVSAATIELHWLPVEARIQFKLCLLVHHTVIGNAPSDIIILRISFSRSPHSQPVKLSCVRPQDMTSKFQERIWSSESAPSASQPQIRGTICRCTSAQPTTPIPLSGGWKLSYFAHFINNLFNTRNLQETIKDIFVFRLGCGT